jgi:hypothetical protein
MPYRAEATSLEGFVQQIACCYLRHGYWFYITGHVPVAKDPRLIDRKLIAKYGIGVSQSTRARRKRLGRANLQYLRHNRRFAILATKGQHDFFASESKSIHDIRRVPLQYGGYSISYRRGGRTRSGDRDARWHAHVEIERRRWIKVNVIAHRPQIAVLTAIDHQGLVAATEQMARELVLAIEARGVGAQEPFHAMHQIGLGRFDDEMEMIAHQAIGVHLSIGFRTRLSQGLKKELPIGILPEDGLPPVPSIT